MDKRTLGTNDLEVSAIGLGCMSMTGGYSDKPDRREMISLIRTALDRGVTFFDTAEIYGPYANEELVGEALAPHQGEVVIATKFGWDIDPVERKPRGRVTSRPEVIKQVVDISDPPATPAFASVASRHPMIDRHQEAGAATGSSTACSPR